MATILTSTPILVITPTLFSGIKVLPHGLYSSGFLSSHWYKGACVCNGISSHQSCGERTTSAEFSAMLVSSLQEHFFSSWEIVTLRSPNSYGRLCLGGPILWVFILYSNLSQIYNFCASLSVGHLIFWDCKSQANGILEILYKPFARLLYPVSWENALLSKNSIFQHIVCPLWSSTLRIHSWAVSFSCWYRLARFCSLFGI